MKVIRRKNRHFFDELFKENECVKEKPRSNVNTFSIITVHRQLTSWFTDRFQFRSTFLLFHFYSNREIFLQQLVLFDSMSKSISS